MFSLPNSASGPDASYSLCEGYQNKASIFAIVSSDLKCSFVLEVRDKRDSWVAAFVATWVAPVPCQPPAGRHRDIPEQSIIWKILVSSGLPPWPRSGLVFLVIDCPCSLFVLIPFLLPPLHTRLLPYPSLPSELFGAWLVAPSPRVFRESCLSQVVKE